MTAYGMSSASNVVLATSPSYSKLGVRMRIARIAGKIIKSCSPLAVHVVSRFWSPNTSELSTETGTKSASLALNASLPLEASKNTLGNPSAPLVALNV
jgi:hypothetical protein